MKKNEWQSIADDIDKEDIDKEDIDKEDIDNKAEYTWDKI